MLLEVSGTSFKVRNRNNGVTHQDTIKSDNLHQENILIFLLDERDIKTPSMSLEASANSFFLSENFFRHVEQKFCGYSIGLTRNARNCNAPSGKVGSSYCYLDRRLLYEIDEIVYEYDNFIINFIDWYTLQYQK